ncbi:NAC domain-containing protein 90-like [Tripterygium wilfordii]|uniref:NAC domain-containing protein 90-like n=2 Tax=Tripterygium wilfordii TaxID=458696 RepID=A0A7J7DVZ4_TRIWF|nr:NAC domain-containing protein 90-like [Tripterygium wilfordii]
MDRVIPVLDIYHFHPSELPHYAGDCCQGDPEQWFFFIPRQESEARGGKPKRLTYSGYWKATGSPGYVHSSEHRIIGVKRTMVFYEGRAPTGTKTEWKINDYKAIDGEPLSSTTTCALASQKLRQEFSLCRVYKKSKSVRAFDRRPVTAINKPAIIQYDQARTAPPVILMEERTTSLDSSSSGDHHHNHCPSQSQTVEAHAGITTMGMQAMDDINEPVLDWKLFDWELFDI